MKEVKIQPDPVSPLDSDTDWAEARMKAAKRRAAALPLVVKPADEGEIANDA